MRKLLPTMLSAGFVAVPAAIATGAEESDGAAEQIKPLYPVEAFEPLAAGQVTKAKLRSIRRLAERDRARRAAARRRQASRRRREARRPSLPAELQAIAACESGGNPRAVGGGGAYRGKYQFDRGTWASVGGSGDPAAAPEAEQDRRAAMLYARAGSSPWPVCG